MKRLKGFQKGINLGGWLSQYMSCEKTHFDTYITEKDIKLIADGGFDHIRLPIDYDIIEDENGADREEGYAHIDDCIDWCKKYGLNMILDLHKTCGYTFVNAMTPEGDSFFENAELQERFYCIWRKLSARYGKNKKCMIFELLNEVVNPDYAQAWNYIAAKTIEAIRAEAPDIGIMVGGVLYNSVVGIPLLAPPADENIIYTFHCFEPLCFTHQKAAWVENVDFDMPYPADISLYRERSRLLKPFQAGVIFNTNITKVGTEFFRCMFREAVKIAEKYNVALYCGEYGVIEHAPTKDTLCWLSDINTVFNEYGIGRALWSYKDMSFGILNDHYHDIINKMIDIVTS